MTSAPRSSAWTFTRRCSSRQTARSSIRDRRRRPVILIRAGTGTWSFVANRVAARSHRRSRHNRDYGSAVMYAPGKVLVMGGGDPPTKTAEVIDLNQSSPTWRAVGSMAVARRQLNATLLPDGTVLVTGGTSGPGFNNTDPGRRFMPQSSGIRRPNSGQRSPAARASLAFTTLVHCCCPMGES